MKAKQNSPISPVQPYRVFGLGLDTTRAGGGGFAYAATPTRKTPCPTSPKWTNWTNWTGLGMA